MQATATPAPAAPGTPPAASPGPAASPSPSPPPLPPAGVVPPAIEVDLAGSVSAAFVAAQVQAALARAAQLRPGATVTIQGLSTAPLTPGTALDAQVAVRIAGNGLSADVAGSSSVHVAVAALAPLDPSLLFYSDDPETVPAGIEGVLFRGTIDAAHPARAYVYHVSATPQRRLYLALTTTGASRVQVLGAQAGPSNAFPFVGHMATVRYLQEQRPQESFVAALDASIPLVVPLDVAAMSAGDLVAAIYDVRLLAGDPVQAQIVTVLGATDPFALVAQPELPGDGHGRRGAFDIANVAPLALAFAVGGPEPEPFEAGVGNGPDGRPLFPNLEPRGRSLAGDYGVLRRVQLTLSNPTAAPQDVYLYESPQGGGATTTIWFDGDPAPTQVNCVSDPSQRYLVKQWTLAPGETRAVGGEYMTDGTSSFPLLFGLTATPPVPVTADLCNARPQPAPSASPAPGASPAPAGPAQPAVSPTPTPDIPPIVIAGRRFSRH
ncbi:MAG TPA: hypothetical protein VFB22_18325 [Candidatus Baltobacteraceae bacterium]|nr:hypothetical protein [Candidatus Baltobacteraceae bacterium]